MDNKVVNLLEQIRDALDEIQRLFTLLTTDLYNVDMLFTLEILGSMYTNCETIRDRINTLQSVDNSEMMRNVAFDLRVPLSPIEGYTKLLQMQDIIKDDKDFVQNCLHYIEMNLQNLSTALHEVAIPYFESQSI